MDYCDMIESLRSIDAARRARAIVDPPKPLRCLGNGIDAVLGKARELCQAVSPFIEPRRATRYADACALLDAFEDREMREVRGAQVQAAARAACCRSFWRAQPRPIVPESAPVVPLRRTSPAAIVRWR